MNVRPTNPSRKRRQMQIRKSVSGTSDRPRLAVFRSNKYIYAQVIDDTIGATLVSASDVAVKKGNKTEKATQVGEAIAKAALKSKIEKVVFDRAGYKFHGRVKALAEAARAAGLQF
jgi:large subunit ribosomal protein L18